MTELLSLIAREYSTQPAPSLVTPISRCCMKDKISSALGNYFDYKKEIEEDRPRPIETLPKP